MKKITKFDLGQLATLLADNVQDSGPEAFDSSEQAIRMHEDDMSECAQDRHGRRLTKKEWAAVARLAVPMVNDQFATWRRRAALVGVTEAQRAVNIAVNIGADYAAEATALLASVQDARDAGAKKSEIDAAKEEAG